MSNVPPYPKESWHPEHETEEALEPRKNGASNGVSYSEGRDLRNYFGPQQSKAARLPEDALRRERQERRHEGEKDRNDGSHRNQGIRNLTLEGMPLAGTLAGMLGLGVVLGWLAGSRR